MVLENLLSEAVLKKENTRRISRMAPGIDLSKLIRMGFNEHPFGMSPKALAAFQETAVSCNYYGDFMAGTLRSTIADFYGMKSENVLIGAGSSALIEIVGRTFLNPGDEVLMCPTFAAFLDMAGINQAKSVVVPLTEDKRYDLEALYEGITDKTKMIVICNPNNPTGTYIGKKELIQFISRVPDDIVILMDEAYIEFATAKDCESMYPLVKAMPHKPIVVLKTFSKFYAMAGVRVGYALASEEIIQAMSKCPNASISRAAQAAAVAAMNDQEYYLTAKEGVVEGINYLEKELTRLGCTVYHTQTNFIMFDPHRECSEVRSAVIERGILINIPMLCRVSVGTMEENRLFIKAMEEILDEELKEYVI